MSVTCFLRRLWKQTDDAEKYVLSNGLRVNWETKMQICYHTKVRTAAVCEVLNSTESTFLPLQDHPFGGGGGGGGGGGRGGAGGGGGGGGGGPPPPPPPPPPPHHTHTHTTGPEYAAKHRSRT
jgi:hypothetical protein